MDDADKTSCWPDPAHKRLEQHMEWLEARMEKLDVLLTEVARGMTQLAKDNNWEFKVLPLGSKLHITLT